MVLLVLLVPLCASPLCHYCLPRNDRPWRTFSNSMSSKALGPCAAAPPATWRDGTSKPATPPSISSTFRAGGFGLEISEFACGFGLEFAWRLLFSITSKISEWDISMKPATPPSISFGLEFAWRLPYLSWDFRSLDCPISLSRPPAAPPPAAAPPCPALLSWNLRSAMFSSIACKISSRLAMFDRTTSSPPGFCGGRQ